MIRSAVVAGKKERKTDGDDLWTLCNWICLGIYLYVHLSQKCCLQSSIQEIWVSRQPLLPHRWLYFSLHSPPVPVELLAVAALLIRTGVILLLVRV